MRWFPVSNWVEVYFKCNCFVVNHARCCVCVGDDGLEVSMRSRMLPDSMRVGSFTIFCNPNSLIISSSLLCLLAVLVFVVCWLSQSMSGRLKSPAITTLGVILCDLYSFVRDV